MNGDDMKPLKYSSSIGFHGWLYCIHEILNIVIFSKIGIENQTDLN